MLTLWDIMVHYDPNSLKAAQPLPPVCPRCGNHRTEIVGVSEDGRTMTVRCNACGERSRVEIASAAPDAPTAPRGDDDGAEEINVMRVVGRALAQLPDAQSRMRVLRWAGERFQHVEPVVVWSPAPGPSPHSRDQALSVDGMDEFFADAGDLVEVRKSATPARPVAIPERLESLVEGFVSDFQRVAIEWQAV